MSIKDVEEEKEWSDRPGRSVHFTYDRVYPELGTHFVKCTDLGAPNKELFIEKLEEFVSSDSAKDFLFTYKNSFPVNMVDKDFYESHINRVVSELIFGLGSYADSIEGLEALFGNFIDILNAPDSTHLGIDCPNVMLVMAGPSLNSQLNRIKEAYDAGWLIICCDISLKRLLDYDIKPQFVVTTERTTGSEKAFEGLSREDLEGVSLAASCVAYPPTVKLFKGHKTFFFPFKPEIVWMPFEDRKFIHGAAHVSSNAYGLARVLGATTIIWAGLDLVYSDNGKSHADLEDESSYGANKKPFELDGHGPAFETELNDGSKGITNLVWNLFGIELKQWHKKYQASSAYKKCLVGTLNPKGIKIEDFLLITDSYIFEKTTFSKKDLDKNPYYLIDLESSIKQIIGTLEEIKGIKDRYEDWIKTLGCAHLLVHSLQKGYLRNRSEKFKYPEEAEAIDARYRGLCKKAFDFLQPQLSGLLEKLQSLENGSTPTNSGS